MCDLMEHCIHVRRDVNRVEDDGKYVYRVTYVGALAVLTAWCDIRQTFITMVVSVGQMSLGDIMDGGQRERVLYERYHHDYRYAQDTHESTLMGLREKMLNLNHQCD